jgi:hypothetical protein
VAVPAGLYGSCSEKTTLFHSFAAFLLPASRRDPISPSSQGSVGQLPLLVGQGLRSRQQQKDHHYVSLAQKLYIRVLKVIIFNSSNFSEKIRRKHNDRVTSCNSGKRESGVVVHSNIRRIFGCVFKFFVSIICT